jgi:hypothetical protein
MSNGACFMEKPMNLRHVFAAGDLVVENGKSYIASTVIWKNGVQTIELTAVELRKAEEMPYEIIAEENDLLTFGDKDGPVVTLRRNGEILVNYEVCTNDEIIVKAIREAVIKISKGPHWQHEMTPTGDMTTGPHAGEG